MVFHEGEHYRCPDPKRACEVTVTKGTQPNAGGDRNPTWCYRKTLDKVEPTA